LREIMKEMPRPAPPAPPPPSPYPTAPIPASSLEEPSVPLPEVVSVPEPERERAQEPARPEPSFGTSPSTGPHTEAAPFPASEAPEPSPSFHAPQDPQLPTGGERETQQRPEPSFDGAPAGQSDRGQQPGRAQPNPSWSHPGWSGQQAPAQPAMRDDQSFPLPYPAGPASPQANPAPPPDILASLPPRPQPSRIQPPPIPPGAPIHGGPVSPRMRGPMPSGPMPPAPMGPPQGAPMAPGSASGPRPNLGHDPAFRSGSPMGAAVSQRSAPDGKVRRKEKRAKSPNVDAGQLAENIPRSMRVGKTSRAEIRIAKSSVKALTEGLEGGGQVWQHAVTITKAMSVRIRAPEGGFFIESASPETQWIESNLGYASDDFASWRFLITPQSRGWSSLQIIVSARTIGADGVAAETALPDQLVEVKVRTNIARTLTRFLSWTVAAIVGGALATFGESGMGTVSALMQKFLH
jgi:neural Wiskott-Aldrich syndrome protein